MVQGVTACMSETTYRIKLYSHISQNPEKFLQDLAAVLGVSTTETLALLRDAPIVIREGLPKDHAEQFGELLKSVGALVLLEPESPETIARAGPSPHLHLSPEAKQHQQNQEDTLRFRVGISVLGVLIALSVLFAGGMVLQSYVRMSAQKQSVTSQNSVKTSADGSSAPVDLEDQFQTMAEELEDQIDAIQARLKELRSQAAAIEGEPPAHGGFGPGAEQEQSYRSDRLNEIKAEMRREQQELKRLKALLQDVLRRQ